MNCEYIFEDGEQCRTPAIRGERFCFFHHPDYERERKQAQSEGGRKGSRKVLEQLERRRYSSREDLIDLLSDTIYEVKTGQLDVKIANATAYIANVLRQVLGESDLERLKAEIEALKEQLGVPA